MRHLAPVFLSLSLAPLSCRHRCRLPLLSSSQIKGLASLNGSLPSGSFSGYANNNERFDFGEINIVSMAKHGGVWWCVPTRIEGGDMEAWVFGSGSNWVVDKGWR
ncbi:Metal-dependent hydrolase, endonuclease/exonuclease/phosphatase [Sesbania bispinosa]|nr:Metal-dependent hydrolase, endonuclease/exonuclease/phosphatase [Sesbania bispinosa]